MVRLVQNSFFGGQLDFEMMGRQDYQRYAKGATKLCNFNVMKRGGLDKRRGFDRILDLVSEFSAYGVQSTTKFRAIPFAYTKTQGFVLLMSGPKCVVVGTNPKNQFKYYDIDDLDGVYTAQEIQELDYQQCGDVLFLAHQNHPPARIVHDIDDVGEHGFHYSSLDIGFTKYGIPSIVGASGSRISVTTDADSVNSGSSSSPVWGTPQASLKTEHYVATAMFDGIETRPCTDYSGNSNPTTKASTWSGTTYRMPWTESQKISLTITPQARTASDGSLEYPTEIRIYKKAFNYFGLIGAVKVTNPSSVMSDTAAVVSGLTRTQNSDETSVDKIDDDEVEVASHGKGLVGLVIEDGQYVEVTSLNSSVVKGFVDVALGNCWYEKTVEEGEAVAMTFHYKGAVPVDENEDMELLVTKNASGGAVVGRVKIRSVGEKELVVERNDEETEQQFLSRCEELYDDFIASIGDVQTVRILVDGLNATSFRLEANNCDIDISNIKVTNTPSSIGNVTFDDTYITPDASITPIDTSDDIPMSATGDYPASVSISQQRLIWASSKKDPERIWMSEIGDFYSYEVHEIMVANDAIDFSLPVTRFAKINHIVEMRKLLLFNSACEWLVDSASSMQGLTYETIQAYPQSYSGSSARLKPIICNNSLIFCERTGQSVRRFAYDLSNDGFAGRDVSILSASIFEFNSIIDWTYQQFPYSTLWCAMKDGSMASFEYMEEQDIMAWLTHRLGGNGECVCVATSYAVSPALDEVTNESEYEYATHEEIFAVVKRGNQLWLERMRPRTKTPTDNMAPMSDTLYHSLCLDGMRVLNTMNGYQPTTEEGAVWIPKDTTDGSTISREKALEKIAAGVEVYEGFPFDAIYVSVYPHVNNGHIGNGQFDIKHVQGAAFRLMHSFGGSVRPVGASTDEPIQYFYNDPENDHRPQFDGAGGVTLFNHDTTVMALPGVNNRDGRIELKQGDPYPFSVLSYELDFEQETGGPR